MYYDNKRIKKYLNEYAIEPDESGYFSGQSRYDDLEISDEVIVTGSRYAGLEASLVWGTHKGEKVVVDQSREGVDLIYKVPDDFDWNVIVPSGAEIDNDPTIFRTKLFTSLDLEYHMPNLPSSAPKITCHLMKDGIRVQTEVLGKVGDVFGRLNYPSYIPPFEVWGVEVDPGVQHLFEGWETEVYSKLRMVVKLPDPILAEINGNLDAEVQRLTSLYVGAVNSGRRVPEKMRFVGHILTDNMYPIPDIFATSPISIVEMWEKKQKDQARRDALWDERERKGVVVVALKRCWECGLTHVVGQQVRGGRTKKMPRQLFDQVRQQANNAHRRSMQDMGDELVSSVGFQPAEDPRFEWVIVDDDWYCGC